MNSSEIQPPDADRIQVGECVVTLSSREVEVAGARRPRRLTPKALGVLRVLLRQPGRVVTREELFAEVWPDTLPTNDVLTQAVTQLRKAFANDEDNGQAYIETIAKSGYRLLVPVQVLDTPEPVMDIVELADPSLPLAAAVAAAPDGAALPVPGLRRTWRQVRRQVLLATGILMLVTVIVLTMLLLRRAPAASSPVDEAVENGVRVIGSPQRPYRLITATSGFETYPTLSPDGSQVAYEGANEDGNGGGAIKVQTSGNAPARQLLVPPAGASDRFPSWSPDGREIAFARFSADGGCQVLIASATGGALRQATRCDGTELLSFDWTPDGRGLVFGSMVGRYAHRGIRVLDLASGQWRDLDYSVDADDFDYAPRYSPDGKWLVFVRNPQMGDLWRMPANGGTPEQLTNEAAEQRGWAWLGDGRTIVFGRRVDSEVRLYYLDVERRTLRDAGLDDAQWPAVSRHGGVLAFVHRRAQFGVFKVPTEGGHAERLFASSGRDGQPMAAPDGRQLVFTSDRSGSFALWWADMQRPDSLRPIEGLRPEGRQAPDWSADSRHLLVVGRDEHGRTVVYEISPRDERLQPLPVPAEQPLQALYAATENQLLVVERDADQRTRLSLFDRSTQPWRRLASIDGVSQARFDRGSGRILFTRLAAGGLWSVDPALSSASVRQISEDRPSRWRYRTWTVAGSGGVGYLGTSTQCGTTLVRIEAGTETPERCLDPQRLSAGNGISASADGRELYVALAVSDGADIGVMRLPEQAPALFPAISRILILKKNFSS
ncbi:MULTISPECIES: winged helix-turn-helix domain-containing protein [Stenotrophomonas]|jgi:Tol biopolymer transport system component/DNA-binding winged helix-turn-helix (wHTH) protein|uniref:winged helix-turn-helix domain-containing protein n=1 Tax=Stenotrophomonas TaxID=40323 RepID=UPI000C15C0C0|nr:MULTISPECIES: winged helix-turn-helix domain-containing protein [Stenotrophomonas]ELC7365652.1 PD40 domain-containing protein [Stenotrophomonas maltophilia]MBA0253505.1 transcriptional regulator [Stenotrophomonas maltophilia]MBA0321782.1 transcriptional regulator [Stenotrophomonas maltophilia]MBH1629482.1 PD40 domain-containing protein [Stenotrophomonas maltophilia]MCI1132931.1 winged helix-turn-helix domain-containing protein [Stenotrophomonas maltophilia]